MEAKEDKPKDEVFKMQRAAISLDMKSASV